MRKAVRSIASIFLVLLLVTGASADVIRPKVLVFAMFEVGANTGDFAGEFQHWFDRYFKDATSVSVRGAFAPVYCSPSGVCGTVVGVGKANAAASLTAILSDPRFDVSSTYFLTSGCAGTPPDRGTLGSVFWSDCIVDYDLGQRWSPLDVTEKGPVFQPLEAAGKGIVLRLDPVLTEWAHRLSRNAPLEDAVDAALYRLRYREKQAHRKPFVGVGTTVCSDTWWHGHTLSREADYLCALYKAGTYVSTQMEDSAVALVLQRHGMLGRYMIARDIVNFDRPYEGQTPKESLAARNGSFSIGMKNGFLVGAAVVDHIVSNWSVWEKGVPPLPPTPVQ